MCIEANTIIFDVIIGIVSGLVASWIYSRLSALKQVSAEKRVNLEIEYLRECAWQLDQELNFNHYDIAIRQADNIMQSILKIYNILPKSLFMLRCTEKRLFFTYCYNLYRFMSRMKMESIGLPEDSENAARCARLRHYLGTDDSSIMFENFLQYNLFMIRSLAMVRNKNTAIANFVSIYSEDCLFKAIDSMSFNDNGFSSKTILRKETLSKEEYESIIIKAVKKMKKKTDKKHKKQALSNKDPYKSFRDVAIAIGCVLGVTILLTVCSQFYKLVARDYLQQTLDTFFNAYTIFYSLMFSTTFLINVRDIKDKERKYRTQKWIRLAQIIMFVFFFAFILSYLDMKSAGLNTLNLILAIALMLIAAIIVLWGMIRIVDYANEAEEKGEELFTE